MPFATLPRVEIWNNYLPVFRNPIHDSNLFEDIPILLNEFFEKMKNSFKELEKKQIIDYDRDTKIQVNANIGLIYARLLENQQKFDDVMRVCEQLLQLPLGSHTRKLINSIKARRAGSTKTQGKQDKPAQGKPGQKGGAPQEQPQGSTEHLLFDVVTQLEIIQNSSVKQQRIEDIKKCFDTLKKWTAKDNDETELELHAELWARLARLAINEENIQMYKYSIKCAQFSLEKLQNNVDMQGIPASRLRW